jgi:hypothetical protein
VFERITDTQSCLPPDTTRRRRPAGSLHTVSADPTGTRNRPPVRNGARPDDDDQTSPPTTGKSKDHRGDIARGSSPPGMMAGHTSETIAFENGPSTAAVIAGGR